MKIKDLKSNKNKHLTYDERLKIQECICKGFHKSAIALEIGKASSTVKREIENNRFIKINDGFNENPFNCVYLNTCRVCTGKCNNFKEKTCLRRDYFIGACNNCPDNRKCKLRHYIYDAKRAEENYKDILKASREGVNLTTTELYNIAHIISPLIQKGQSPYTIVQNHPELNIGVKTLYNYISMGLFKDWGIDNLSLKRKTKRRIKSKTLKKRKESTDYTGRRYEDYLQYKLDNPDLITTEMDTIYNHQSGPYIQTFIFGYTGLMIGILHSEKTADSMSKAMDYFQEILTDEEYKEIFSLLLTDRGSEFAKPVQFEVNMATGEIRSKIFYCDPQMPSQKPHVENNHVILRDIIPNRISLKNLTQEKLELIFSHINCVTRKSLGNKSPYEVFSFLYGEKILQKLKIQKIGKDEVCLTPHLLK